jgi:TonB-linked SusC/RagA family outer membrane protein
VFDSNPQGLPDVNFQDAIFRLAQLQSHQVSVTGGDEKTQYFFSGNFLDQDGIIINSNYTRYSGRAKIDSRVSKFLKVGLNIAPSFTTEKRITDGHWANDGVVLAALACPPMVPIYNPDGTFASAATYAVASDGLTGVTNPVANSTIKRNYQTFRSLNNIYIQIDFMPGLILKSTAGADLTYQRYNYFRPSTVPLNGKPAPVAPTDRSANASTFQNINWLNENTLSYNKTFAEIHTIDAVAGFTLQKNTYETSASSGSNYPNDIIQVIDKAQVKSGSGSKSQWAMVSYLARANYRLLSRYFLTASIRSDGSSRFGKDSKYGYFPSASAAWQISNESFMKKFESISNLKLRFGYGEAGNNMMTGGDYVAQGLVNISDNAVFGNGSGNVVSGASQSSLQNNRLTWEKEKQFDAGLELGIFKNRLSVTADYYNRTSTDLLLNVQIPAITGFTTAWQNIGKMNNKGWEFTVNSKNIVRDDFSWNTDFNISFNKNKVLALGPNNTPIYGDGGAGTSSITMVGQPIGQFFGYKMIGIFQNQEEINNYPHFADAHPGDVKWADVNDDKKITADDRTIIGNNQPKFIFGLNNRLNFKSFDFGLMTYGSYGADILQFARRFYTQMEGNQNQMAEMINRWHSESDPGNGKIPRANAQPTNQNNAISSRWVENGSFFRISNLTLGYNLPVAVAKKISMERCRIYLSIQNLYTFTKYSGYNPEVSFQTTSYGGSSMVTSNVLAPGTDYGGYPTARTISIGCNLTF